MEIRRLVRVALLTALVAVATLVLRVPMPATEGYINVGDAIIVSGALLFGGVVAGVSGGLGSALADGLGGYAHWAPFTLIIKGVEGLVIGISYQWLKPGVNSTDRAYGGYWTQHQSVCYTTVHWGFCR